MGLAVYIMSMAAGVKLFSCGTLPWWASLVSFVLCLLCLPFFGVYMAVPIAMSLLYSLYMAVFRKRQTAAYEQKTDGAV